MVANETTLTPNDVKVINYRPPYSLQQNMYTAVTAYQAIETLKMTNVKPFIKKKYRVPFIYETISKKNPTSTEFVDSEIGHRDRIHNVTG